MNKKILLGMSGGVDSSVAALMLKQAGWDVYGVTLTLHGNEDTEDAQRVAQCLDIPFHTFDLTKLFSERVQDYFVQEYLEGRTPNPCIACNRHIKFGAMLEHAKELGIDYIATGHYANVKFDEARGRYILLRSDSPKDQSYVLYHLTQEQLAHTVFPLQEGAKEDIRRLAEAHNLPVAHKSDSQEICFIPDKDYAGFIERRTGSSPAPGDFVDFEGNVLGKHKGIIHYTIGQRKGLGMSFGKHMYVCELNALNNTVTLGPDGSQTARGCIIDDLNYIAIEKLDSPLYAEVKVRYQAKPARALLTPLADSRVSVEFDTPQRSLTPGQAAVFYDGGIVLGGGTIKEVLR